MFVSSIGHEYENMKLLKYENTYDEIYTMTPITL